MFVGKHIVIECKGQHAHLSEGELESILSRAAWASGATVLSSHFHRFGPQMGVTGVLILAESHITAHTWPEHDYAAFDVFMCGTCEPERAVEVIVSAASAEVVKTYILTRGIPTSVAEPSLLSFSDAKRKLLQASDHQESQFKKQEPI